MPIHGKGFSTATSKNIQEKTNFSDLKVAKAARCNALAMRSFPRAYLHIGDSNFFFNVHSMVNLEDKITDKLPSQCPTFSTASTTPLRPQSQ